MASEMSFAVEGEMLVIRLPMRKNPTPSSTGKTLVVASTAGNKPTDIKVKGKTLTVGVNAYISAND